MRVIKFLVESIKEANQDLEAVKVLSVYFYLIIGASAMLVGLLIGLAN